MSPIARKHHYLPQAYLAEFTETGTKDGQFFVRDVSNGKRFKTSPKNVAVERDFNRVDVEGESLDIIECELASFEALAAESIKKVIETQEFPTTEEFTNIINLLCLLAVRNPKHRRLVNDNRAKIKKREFEFLVSDERTFQNTIKKAKEAGYLQENDIPFLELKAIIEEKRYEIQFTSEGNMELEFNVFDTLLPILARRLWSVTIAPSSGPIFVCSDDPVTLTGKNLELGMPIGFGMPHTEVFLPLSPRVGFYGVYENPDPPVMFLTPEDVAKRNFYIASNADRHIFSKEAEFMIFHEGKIQPFLYGLASDQRQGQ